MGTDIGIDLGTYKTIVYLKGKGIVFNEPSVIAYNLKTNEVVAVGERAYQMVGRTPAYIKTVRPILNGVIADYDYAEKMLTYILSKISYSKIFKPRIAICIPSIVTGVERKAIIDSAVNIGAKKVYVIDEPMAAAIGCKIDISKPKGRLIIDIGGGSTDIALLSLNGIVVKNSIRVAGDKFDEAVIKVVKNLYGIEIGNNMAKKIKETVGTLIINYEDSNCYIKVRGKNLKTGLPKEEIAYPKDFIDIFNDIYLQIMEQIKIVVEKTPPDLLNDIQNGYILLTGGGSQLKGLKEKIQHDIKLKVISPENSTEVVGIGTGNCFKYIKDIDDGLIEQSAYRL